MSDESKYNKFSGPGRPVLNYEEAKNPGDFYFTDGERTYFHCRLSEDDFISIPVNATGVSPCWQWDGNRERPTIAPSIHLIGHWHGFVQDGQIKSC